jgi:hypothetical protein
MTSFGYAGEPAQCRDAARYCPRFDRRPCDRRWPAHRPCGRNPSRSSLAPRERSALPAWHRSLAAQDIGGAWSHRTSARSVCGTKPGSCRALAIEAISRGAFLPTRFPITARVTRSGSDKRSRAGSLVRRVRFSAARYLFCKSSSWFTEPVT